MSKSKGDVPTQANPTVTQETLDATPERVVQFLRAVGTVPAVRASLAARGYTPKEHDRGWQLLHAASGYDGASSADFGTEVDPVVQGAIAALDAWDEDGFRIVRAALTHRHPEQAKAVLAGLGASAGGGAVVAAAQLLDRLDALAKSKAAGDAAAVKTLAARGVTADERKRLRGLVQIAQKGTSVAVAAPDPKARAKEAERQKALVDLRAWYEEWSEMARAIIKRRDRLIRLGLAKRKSPKKAARGAPDAS
jgi:hypothetical protein